MPAIDVVTNPSVAYLRLHGRNEHGYISGKSSLKDSTTIITRKSWKISTRG